MTSRSALIIEDDPDIADLLTIHLKDLGLSVEIARNGVDGLARGLSGDHSLIILDLMLPRLEGKEILRGVREKNKRVPILVLTLKTELLDKVLCLELGADDYLTKPFSIEELIARVKALLRRVDWDASEAGVKKDKITVGDLVIDLPKRKIELDGNPIELTPKQFDLLLFMAKSPGRAYSRTELLNYVWGYEHSGYEHTVDTHVNRLRAQLEPDPSKPVFILTVWGVGYRFTEKIELSAKKSPKNG